MRIKGRNLVDLGEREFHLQGQRREMGGGQIAVMVLDQMQMLDQQIAPARSVGEQRAHFVERRRVDLTALGRARRLAAACFGVRRSRLEVHERHWPGSVRPPFLSCAGTVSYTHLTLPTIYSV